MKKEEDIPSLRRTLIYLAWVMAMGLFFANAEIQIEGGAGWATSLPTWRIEKHLLLDLFWGGRAMTGYHAWVFTFMILVFLMPLAFNDRWRGRDFLLAAAGLIVFWIAEDFLWFVLNPEFGWARFDAAHGFWHRHWWWGAPADYWVGGAVALLIVVGRHRPKVRYSPARIRPRLGPARTSRAMSALRQADASPAAKDRPTHVASDLSHQPPRGGAGR